MGKMTSRLSILQMALEIGIRFRGDVNGVGCEVLDAAGSSDREESSLGKRGEGVDEDLRCSNPCGGGVFRFQSCHRV